MRYIKKHHDAPIVIRHEQELASAHLDEASLNERRKKKNLDGNVLYRQIRSTEFIQHWKDLQGLLDEEQGGVCCYCGMRLMFPDTRHYSVEHVKPRSLYPELVGEYKNLLLSCHSSEEDRAEIKKTIRNKRDRRRLLHCDEFKEDKELHCSPLEPDCHKHFSYKLNGVVNGNDDLAKADIDTLNLNCERLVTRRREQMLSYLFIDEEGAEMLDNDFLKKFRDKIEERDNDGNHYEFYFVIADMIDNILTSTSKE